MVKLAFWQPAARAEKRHGPRRALPSTLWLTKCTSAVVKLAFCQPAALAETRHAPRRAPPWEEVHKHSGEVGLLAASRSTRVATCTMAGMEQVTAAAEAHQEIAVAELPCNVHTTCARRADDERVTARLIGNCWGRLTFALISGE